MDIKQGEVFESSTDGAVFTVKQILRGMVLLESQDRKRQILTGVDTLKSTSFHLKKRVDWKWGGKGDRNGERG